MTEWQPIETAPKDGTLILTAYWWKGRPVYRIGKSQPAPRSGWLMVPGEWAYSPTHWQPLPAPPASVDGRRMAETGTGPGRSPTSAVANGETP